MQVSNLRGRRRNMRQTVIENNGECLLVVTSDITHVETGYPYETGVFHIVHPKAKTLNGQIDHINAIQRADTPVEALHNHITAIAVAVDYLNSHEA